MWNLIKKEVKEILHNKKIWYVIIIVSIITIIGTYCSETKNLIPQEERIKIGVVDLDDSIYSKMLIGYFKENKTFSEFATIDQGNQAEIEDLFEKESISCYLIIPKDFAQNMRYLNNVPIEGKINGAHVMTAILIQNVLRGYEKYITAVEVNAVGFYDMMEALGMEQAIIERKNREISFELIFTALGRNDFFEYTEYKNKRTVSLISYYQAACVGIIIMYISMYVGFLFLKEKEIQIMMRGKAAGIGIISYGFSKLIIHGGFLSGFVLLFYTILNSQNKNFDFKNKAVVLVSMVFLFLLFSLLLAWICRYKKSYMIAGNFCYLFFCMVGGGIIPFMYLPERVAALGKLTPLYWFIHYMT